MKHLSEADRHISAVLAQFMEWRDETNEDVAVALGCSAQTVGRKRRGTRAWDAAEVDALAQRYGVPEQAFYDGVDALFAGVRISSLLPPFPGESRPTTAQHAA